jgi:hypothetical protein
MRPEANRPVSRVRSVRLGAVVAVALAAGFLVWLLVGRGGSSSPRATTAAATTTTTAVTPILEAASLQTLKTLPAFAGHQVYWAGPRRATTYELTRTSDGRIYIRYLPKGVKVGDRRADFLIVGTYPVPNAYRAIQTAAKEQGATTFGIGGGGLAVLNRSAPHNVYFAYPRSAYQVEVFDPHTGVARRLVASGSIRPLG